MEKKHTNPKTKDAALQQLGVVSKKARRRLAGHVEFVEVVGSRRLLSTGDHMRSVLVGLSGSATISGNGGQVTFVEAPLVIDTWASDGHRLATMTVVTGEQSVLLLIDVRSRDAVFAQVPALGRLAKRTQEALTAVADPIVDLRVPVTTPEPVLG